MLGLHETFFWVMVIISQPSLGTVTGLHWTFCEFRDVLTQCQGVESLPVPMGPRAPEDRLTVRPRLEVERIKIGQPHLPGADSHIHVQIGRVRDTVPKLAHFLLR